MKKPRFDFGILGGDARQYYTALTLMEQGLRIGTFLISPHIGNCTETFPELVQNSAVLVLPVPFPHILQDGSKPEEIITAYAKPSLLLCSGAIPDNTVSLFRRQNLTYFDVMKEERFTLQNAKLTAEGVLSALLSSSDGCVNHSRILLTGYGRCGRAIAECLRGLSPRLTICDNRAGARQAAQNHGYAVLEPQELLSNRTTFDYCINTVPSLIFDRAVLKKALHADTVFLDIASAPGGIDRDAACELGLSVTTLPALPTKTAPKAAGKYYAQAISEWVCSQSAVNSIHTSAPNPIQNLIRKKEAACM